LTRFLTTALPTFLLMANPSRQGAVWSWRGRTNRRNVLP
jgi:hypothetical protein